MSNLQNEENIKNNVNDHNNDVETSKIYARTTENNVKTPKNNINTVQK